MSFALTTTQVLDRTKTVTRRLGWETLKPGTLLQAVEKGQGLKKGERVRKLAVIRVVDIRRERLDAITGEDVVREGFPKLSPRSFVLMFCDTHRKCMSITPVTRIEFEYVDEVPA